jgi:membrane fusion protein, peptide pheromone/bacteriocin exporter
MIFPKEIIENTSNFFQHKREVRSRLIFGLILFLLICAFGALPYLKTDIYVTGNGIIKPDMERKNIVSPTTGFILENRLKNNLLVRKGDTLLVFDGGRLRDQIQEVNREKELSKDIIKDLNYLLFAETIKWAHIGLPFNRTNFLKYDQELIQLDTRLAQSKMILDRQSKLFKVDVISKAEFEKASFGYELLVNQKKQLILDQNFAWESERKNEKLKLLEFENVLRSLKRNLDEQTFVAPISGTLLNVKGVETGSYVNAGMALAEISPETDLIIETFISPGDIGLIRQNSLVNYQIEAYNYNRWGLASGEITEISNDLEWVNDQAVFKVRSTLNEKSLFLKNGFEGKLKKGLTLSARYLITERSLFDLLYDKLDDWLNPSQNKPQTLTLNNNGIY